MLWKGRSFFNVLNIIREWNSTALCLHLNCFLFIIVSYPSSSLLTNYDFVGDWSARDTEQYVIKTLHIVLFRYFQFKVSLIRYSTYVSICCLIIAHVKNFTFNLAHFKYVSFNMAPFSMLNSYLIQHLLKYLSTNIIIFKVTLDSKQREEKTTSRKWEKTQKLNDTRGEIYKIRNRWKMR